VASKWCPQCGAEYREGFSECADCGVALANQPPAAKAKPEHHREPRVGGPFSPDDDTVELLRTNPLEAEVIAARLQSEGIPVAVFDDDPYGNGPFPALTQGVRVMVRRGDLAVAAALTADTH
jgi:hypothetical protein